MKVILNNNLKTDNYEYQEFFKAAKELDIELIDIRDNDSFEGINATINRSYLRKDINNQYGESYNKIIDSLFWKDKINQLKYLNIPIPKPNSLYGTNLSFNEIREEIGVPFVVKESQSCKGNNVALIKNQQDMSQYFDLFQEPIYTSTGKDVRVLAIEGNIVATYERYNENDFRSNVAQGGDVKQVEVQPIMIDVAKAIYDQTKLDFIGVDLLYDGNGGYVFCELNVNPGFKGCDKAYNTHIAKEILSYVKKKTEENYE